MTKKFPWAEAAKNGLILSTLTVAVSVISELLPLVKETALVSVPLFLIKFAGSAYLLYYFMKKHSESYDTLSYRESFTYGFVTSCFSSIVCTFATVLIYFVIVPERMEELAFMASQILEQADMAGMYGDDIITRLPMYIVPSNFLNCIFWGVVFSLIIASKTKKTPNNPFE